LQRLGSEAQNKFYTGSLDTLFPLAAGARFAGDHHRDPEGEEETKGVSQK